MHLGTGRQIYNATMVYDEESVGQTASEDESSAYELLRTLARELCIYGLKDTL